jgi:hypothetical protein
VKQYDVTTTEGLLKFCSYEGTLNISRTLPHRTHAYCIVAILCTIILELTCEEEVCNFSLSFLLFVYFCF